MFKTLLLIVISATAGAAAVDLLAYNGALSATVVDHGSALIAQGVTLLAQSGAYLAKTFPAIF